jgi:prepilin-type processing-associated H-X9-DG protein
MAIITILIGLTLSAVQRARAASNLTRCEYNLKQIGVGLINFENQRSVFPSNGGWDGSQTIMSTANVPFTPETNNLFTGSRHQWGVGDPALSPTQQTGSWAYSILPYLEQDEMYQKRTWAEGEPLYTCPARRDWAATVPVSQDAYGDYLTGGWAWGKIDYAGNRAAVRKRPKCYADNEFIRGRSVTILVGEKAFDADVQANNWYYDEPFFLGGSAGTVRSGDQLYRDGPGARYEHNWGSNHISGVNFLFGDGSVRLYNFKTDADTMDQVLSLD